MKRSLTKKSLKRFLLKNGNTGIGIGDYYRNTSHMQQWKAHGNIRCFSCNEKVGGDEPFDRDLLLMDDRNYVFYGENNKDQQALSERDLKWLNFVVSTDKTKCGRMAYRNEKWYTFCRSCLKTYEFCEYKSCEDAGTDELVNELEKTYKRMIKKENTYCFRCTNEEHEMARILREVKSIDVAYELRKKLREMYKAIVM